MTFFFYFNLRQTRTDTDRHRETLSNRYYQHQHSVARVKITVRRQKSNFGDLAVRVRFSKDESAVGLPAEKLS